MRILLDESLPRKLAGLLIGHDVVTVAKAGWSSKKNGELLQLAASRFDVFITADQSLRFQQNLAAMPIAVVILKALKNDIEHLGPLVPRILEALKLLPMKTIVQIAAQDAE